MLCGWYGMAKTDPWVSYSPRSGTTPESEVATLARVYAFVLSRSSDARAGEELRNGLREREHHNRRKEGGVR